MSRSSVVAVSLAMRVDERLAQRGDIAERLLVDDELMRIGPAVVAHRDRFAAPDDLRAADPEVRPAPPGEIGGVTIGRAVPAFHRQDAPAIAGPHRRSWPRVESAVRVPRRRAGSDDSKPSSRLSAASRALKRVGRLQAGDAGIRHGRIVYPIRRLDNTARSAVRRLSLIRMLPRRILPMMSSRGALAVALFVAVVRRVAGVCQLRCVGGQSPAIARGTVRASARDSPPAPARHSCHASTSNPADIAVNAVDESCRHPSSIAAVLASDAAGGSSSAPALHAIHRPPRLVVASRALVQPRALHDSALRSFRRHAPHLVER